MRWCVGRGAKYVADFLTFLLAHATTIINKFSAGIEPWVSSLVLRTELGDFHQQALLPGCSILCKPVIFRVFPLFRLGGTRLAKGIGH